MANPGLIIRYNRNHGFHYSFSCYGRKHMLSCSPRVWALGGGRVLCYATLPPPKKNLPHPFKKKIHMLHTSFSGNITLPVAAATCSISIAEIILNN